MLPCSDAMRRIRTQQLFNPMKTKSRMMKHKPEIKEVGRKNRRIMILWVKGLQSAKHRKGWIRNSRKSLRSWSRGATCCR
jgi:hypothetical protein